MIFFKKQSSLFSRLQSCILKASYNSFNISSIHIMKKLCLFWLLMGISFLTHAQQSLSVTGVSSTTICMDSFNLVTVAYQGTATFQANNAFVVQLSDVNGSFANPTYIGNHYSTSPTGIILAFSPAPVIVSGLLLQIRL